MGQLKAKKQDDNKEYPLTEYEFEYVKALAQARNAQYNQWQGIISNFMGYIAGSRLGLKDELVDFELLEDKKSLRISPHKDI